MLLVPLFVVFGALTVVLGLCNVLLSPEQKKRLQALLEESWLRYSDLGPSFIVKAPISVACKVVDRVLGPHVYSRRSFVGMFAATAAIQLASLALLGFGNGHVLGIEKWPMQEFAEYKDSDASDLPAKPESSEETAVRKAIENWWPTTVDRWLRAPEQRLLHDSLLILSMVFLPTALSSFSWMVSRKMLSKMLKAEDAWDLAANFSFNVLYIGCTITVVSGVLSFVLVPLARGLYLIFFAVGALGGDVGILFGLIGHLVVSVGSIIWGQSWFLATLGVCFVPSIVVALLLVVSLLSHLVRIPVYKGLDFTFLRMVQFNGGVVACLLGLVGAITTIVGLLRLL